MRLLAVVASCLSLAVAADAAGQPADDWRRLLDGRRNVVIITRDGVTAKTAEMYYTFLPSGDLRIETPLLSTRNLPLGRWRQTATGVCVQFPPNPQSCHRFVKVTDGWEFQDEVGNDPARHVVFSAAPPSVPAPAAPRR